MRSNSESDYCMKWKDCCELNTKQMNGRPEVREKNALRAREQRAWFSSVVDVWKISQGCVRCGKKSSIPTEFEMDHKDPTTKLMGISDLCGKLNKNKSEDIEKFIEEMNKCQVLCRACHVTKTRSELRKYEVGSSA